MREITYHKEGDYYIPNLYLAEDEYEKNYHIGKYGHLRLEYLKKHKKADYTIMFMDGTLRKHIVDTDKQAKARIGAGIMYIGVGVIYIAAGGVTYMT